MTNVKNKTRPKLARRDWREIPLDEFRAFVAGSIKLSKRKILNEDGQHLTGSDVLLTKLTRE